MGAFADLTIPVVFSSPGAAVRAYEIAYGTAGSRNVAVDAAAGTISMQLQFPGNLTQLVVKLDRAGILTRGLGRVSLPVRSLAAPERQTVAAEVPEAVEKGSPVKDVTFEVTRWVRDVRLVGDRIEASIVPDTKALHWIYDALLHEGLIAQDTPTLVALRGL